MEVCPVAGALGAEILGADLGLRLDDDDARTIRRALLDHLVVFFRDQDLNPAAFRDVVRRFGTPIEYPFVRGFGRTG